MDKIKHQLSAIYSSIPFWKVIGVLVALEIISFGGFEFPWMNTATFFALLLVAFVASLKRLHWGVLMLFAELCVGSKGYLFEYSVSGHPISIRLGLFLVVCLATAIWMIRDKQIRFFTWRLWKPYVIFIAALVLAAGVGILRHNGLSNIFFDANGYLYIGLIFPLTQSIRNRTDMHQLLAVILAATVTMMLETLVVLFAFAHLETFTYTLPEVYKWIRDTGVGEITRFPNGFSRVFFQSHIFAVYLFAFSAVLLACLGVGKAQMRDRVWRGIVALFALSGITVFLSYSRSFWVAVAAAGAVTLVWVLLKERVSFKRLLAVAILFIGIGLVDYAAIIGIVNFPLPGHVGVSSQSLLSDRTSNIGSEPAAASRWQLVKPLATASLHHAITGSGFGKTITYTSSDPRVVVEHPDGQYTTYAFEWGYLDLWLKMGAIGVIAYAWLCIAILRAGYVQWKVAIVERPFVSGLLASLICLFGVHVFTPYLNHPLGIGWLLVVSLFFVNTVYEHAE